LASRVLAADYAHIRVANANDHCNAITDIDPLMDATPHQ
jgi:hypothetical protein